MKLNQRNQSLIERYASHPLKANVERALMAAEKFGDRAAAIRSNRDLSDEGRTKELQAQIRSTLRDIRDAGAPLSEMRAKLDALQATITKPQFDKTDVAGALARREIREAIRGLSLGDRAALLVGDGADERFVTAVLEQPALLSGTPPELYERALTQRLETLFKAEIAQGEQLDNQIAEAEAGLTIARQDIAQASGLKDHEFGKLVDEVNARKSKIWLKREDRNGSEVVVVAWPLEGHVRRIATADDIYNDRYYDSYEEYLADRTVA
jgi:hypothetical protein